MTSSPFAASAAAGVSVAVAGDLAAGGAVVGAVDGFAAAGEGWLDGFVASAGFVVAGAAEATVGAGGVVGTAAGVAAVPHAVAIINIDGSARRMSLRYTVSPDYFHPSARLWARMVLG